VGKEYVVAIEHFGSLNTFRERVKKGHFGREREEGK